MRTFRQTIFIAVLGGLATQLVASADIVPVPGKGYEASSYEKLWAKSPFAVASAETAVPESPDYSLVGIAEVDGVYYASLIERKSQEHFLLAGDEPDHGLTLVSVTEGKDVAGTSAVVKKNGQSLTLKLEETTAPAVAASTSGAPSIPSIPQTPVAAETPAIPTAPGQGPPPANFHRRVIHIPQQTGSNPGINNMQGQIHHFTSQAP